MLISGQIPLLTLYIIPADCYLGLTAAFASPLQPPNASVTAIAITSNPADRRFHTFLLFSFMPSSSQFVFYLYIKKSLLITQLFLERAS